MLDQATKRAIESARQILVGKVPDPKMQVGHITTALIYRRISDCPTTHAHADAPLSNIPFSSIPSFRPYPWRELLKRSLSDEARYNRYNIELASIANNGNIPSVLREIFTSSRVPYRDHHTLTLFLNEIDRLSFQHSEDIGTVFEYLLALLGSQREAGQFRTPRHIIDFMVRAVAPKARESVLDPACGTASFLISASYSMLESVDDDSSRAATMDMIARNLTGYDIAPGMVQLALANMYLHNIDAPQIYEYDTLTSKERWDDTFDIILANPPFMTPKGGIRPHEQFDQASSRSELLFTDYIIEHLNPSGRAGIIVPEGVVFQSGKSYQTMRKKILEHGLYAVISLPSGVFQPYSGVKTRILLVDKALRRNDNKTLFITIRNDGYSLDMHRRKIKLDDLPDALMLLQHWQRGDTASAGSSEIANVVDRSSLLADPQHFLTDGLDRGSLSTRSSADRWPTKRLGQLATVRMGETLIKKDLTGSGIPIFSADSSEKPWGYSDSARLSFGPDTIVIGARGTLGSIKFPRLPRFTCTQTTIAITVGQAALAEFIYWLLVGYDFSTMQEGVAIPMITVRAVSNITMPHPPIAAQQEILDDIRAERHALDRHREKIDVHKRRIREKIDAIWHGG